MGDAEVMSLMSLIPEKLNTQHTNLPQHQLTNPPQLQLTNLPQPQLQPINPLLPLPQPQLQLTNQPQNQSILQLQLKLQRSTTNLLHNQRNQRSTKSQYPTTNQK